MLAFEAALEEDDSNLTADVSVNDPRGSDAEDRQCAACGRTTPSMPVQEVSASSPGSHTETLIADDRKAAATIESAPRLASFREGR